MEAGRISGGDIIGVKVYGKDDPSDLINGVVVRLEETGIIVSVEEDINDDDGLLAVIKVTSEVTHERHVKGLDSLERAVNDPTHVANRLVRTLLDGNNARFDQNQEIDLDESLRMKLNEKQQEAVEQALRAKDLCVVHGPPGTGKTHTVVAYVLAEVQRGNRVLVVAPSNVAVDNLAERLAGWVTKGRKIKFVRAGHPARIMPSVGEYGLDAMLMRTEEAGLAKDIRKEISKLERKAAKLKDRVKRKGIRIEIRQLRKELRKTEKIAVRRLLGTMNVVLSTISGAGAHVLDIAEGANPFDVVVVDEAAQALEAACWVPLLRANKAVLAGDPYQLAGMVKSMEAEGKGLKRSILDRVFKAPALKSCVTMLTTQYRMNDVISTWSSQEFYEGSLVADSSVADHKVRDLDSCHAEVEDEQNLINPFIVIDTVGGDCEEDETMEENIGNKKSSAKSDSHVSRTNKGEAEIVCRVIDEFRQCGLTADEIAVISPYSGQVEMLRRKLWPKYNRNLEIATVDSFQGREKEVICMSLVRSNEKGEVGFLSDDRRLNVAITRARRCVVVVCDSETVGTHPLLNRMIEYAENYGLYRSAVTDFEDIVGTVSIQRRPTEAIEAEQRSASSKKKGQPNTRKQKQGNTRDRSRQSGTGSKRGKAKGSSKRSEKDELRKIVQSFAEQNHSQEKIFDSSLSALERRIVHELATEYNLGHETKDVKDGRQIRVWKE